MRKAADILEKILVVSFCLFLVLSPYSKYVSKTCFVISALWLLVNILRHQKRFYRGFIPVTPLNRTLLGFGIACFIAIVLSKDPNHSQAIFFERYIVYALFFWIGVGLARSGKNLYWLSIAFMLSGLVFGLGGLHDYLYHRYNVAVVARIWSVFGRTIIYYGFPLYLAYFIPFNVSVLVFGRNKLLRALAFLNVALLVFCLIANASRLAVVAVLASILFVILIKVRKKTLFTGLAIALVAVSLFFVSLTVKERLKTIPDPQHWSNRLPLYSSALSVFRDHPLVGVGLGMFERVLGSAPYALDKSYPVPRELNLHAHNTYLEVAAEMGLVGFLAFGCIFFLFFKKSLPILIRPRPEWPSDDPALYLGLFATVVAILIFGCGTTIITVGLPVSSYFWFLFGMAASRITYEA